jgi:hypothetical protein
MVFMLAAHDGSGGRSPGTAVSLSDIGDRMVRDLNAARSHHVADMQIAPSRPELSDNARTPRAPLSGNPSRKDCCLQA